LGWGEFSHKDFETTLLGCVLVKPGGAGIVNYPNIYEDGVTCVCCRLDYTDLEDKIMGLLQNPQRMLQMQQNTRERFESFTQPGNQVADLARVFAELTAQKCPNQSNKKNATCSY
jgi:hypothetical protein